MKFKERKLIILFLITLFAIAMGFMEGVIVFYLRLLPITQNSLSLPAAPHFPREILFVEQLREIATIVMLVVVALLAGKNNWQRLFVFIFIFSIWDLIYYSSLYWLAHWPTSLFEMDVVFLIPIQWMFPVYFPVFIFIVLALFSAYKILKN